MIVASTNTINLEVSWRKCRHKAMVYAFVFKIHKIKSYFLIHNSYLVHSSISLPLVTEFFEVIEELKSSNNSLKLTQPVITCSKLTIGTLERGVTYVQS